MLTPFLSSCRIKMKLLTPFIEVDSLAAWIKIFLAWLAYYIGSFFSNLGVILAGIFTFLQIIALLRREFGWFKKTNLQTLKDE